MSNDRLARIRYVPVSLIAASATVLAASWFIAAVLSVSDVLQHDVSIALRPVERAHEGMFMIVCGPPTGVAAGIQLGLAGLLFGGVPAALVAAGVTVFRRRHTWSGAWENVFFAAFLFQLSSMALTLLLLVPVILFGYSTTDAAFGGMLRLSVLCNFWGLWLWRRLQLSVTEAPSTIFC